MLGLSIINEVAVIGCTFLMLAVATIWYSSSLFGELFQSSATQKSEQKYGSAVSLLVRGVCYAILLSLLAYTLALAPLAQLTLLQVALGFFIVCAAVLAAYAVAEEKTLIHYAVHASFYFIFICGGAFVITYWPW